MAKEKKSFIAYCNWKSTFDALPDEDAGKLIKHLLAYVNDENPKTDSVLINAVFANIKDTLKRDLGKYDIIKEKRSLAGKASAEKRKQNSTNSTSVESVKQMPTNPTVNVSDNVSGSDNVNDKEILKKGDKPQSFNFKQSLIDLGIEKQIADDWMKVRSKKGASNTKTAFKSIKTNIEKSKVSANECIKIAVEKDWRGFEASWLTNSYNDKPKPQITDKQAYANRKMGLDEPDDGVERLFYTFKGDGWVNRYFSQEELEDFIVRTQSEILKSSPKRM